MSKINFNITDNDRNIASLLSSPKPLLSLDQAIGSGTNDKLAEGLTALIQLFNELSTVLDKSSKKMKEFYAETEKSSQMSALERGIKSLNNLKPFPVTNDKKSESIWDKNLESLKKIGNFDTTAFNKISETFTGLSQIFAGDEATANVMKWAQGFADMSANLAKGDPLGAAVSAGKVISSIITTHRQAQKEIDKFYSELEQAAINYSIKVIAAAKDIKSANDSIFNTNTGNKLAQGMTGFNDAQIMLDKLYDRLGNETIQTGKKKKKFLGVTTGTKTYWGDVLSNYKKILDTDKDLIDATGNLDMSVANSLLQSGKLSGEASKTLTEMVNVQTAADAAIKQVNDTLTSMSGTLGTNLQTALVSAFQSGTDAADEFGKSVAKTLEGIITDQMFNIVFGEKLKTLEDRMKGSYSDGGDMDITDDIAWFYNTYSTSVDQFNQGLSQMKEQVNGMTGLDVLANTQTPKTTQSTSRGYSVSMSEDTGSVILGRVTGLHETGLRLETGINTMLGIQSEGNKIFTEQSSQLLQLCSVNVQSMYHLEDINKNTKHLAGIKQDLQDIKQNTARL